MTNNYVGSAPASDYIPGVGYEWRNDLGLDATDGHFPQTHEGPLVPSANDVDLQSLSPDYYLPQHSNHGQQYPATSAMAQQYGYQSHDEQQQAWNAQYQAAAEPFNRAPAATQSHKTSHQSSTAASRARQTPTNKPPSPQYTQQTPRRASPASARPAPSIKPPQPTSYTAYPTAFPPKHSKASAPNRKPAGQPVVTEASRKKNQRAQAQSAAKTSMHSSNGAKSGIPHGDGGQVHERYPYQPQEHIYVGPSAAQASSASQNGITAAKTSLLHVQQTKAADADVSAVIQSQLVDPMRGLRGQDVVPKTSNSKISSDPAPRLEKRESRASKPTTPNAPPQIQNTSFSVALSKGGLGHFGGIQFWESVDEYIQHSKTVSELHEKGKTYAKWVVHHDKELRANVNYNVVDEVDKLMQSFFHTEDPGRYNHQGVRLTQGRSVIQPETIVRQLEAGITLILSADPERVRGLGSPSSSSVKKLKQDAIRGHIEFYQCQVQALALIVCHIISGKQDDLVASAMDGRVLEAAKHGMQGTNKAVEAYYRGTASVQQKFYYMDELKNGLSATLRKKHTQTAEEVKTDAAWLQAHIAAAAELQLRLAVPKIGDLHLAPDLTERTLSYLEDIIYQAHAELQRITQDTTQQKTSLGKHPRTRDDAEREKDKEMMPPPPPKMQKTTKSPTKQTPPHESKTKKSSPTKQALSQPATEKGAADNDEVFIVGIKPVHHASEGGTAGPLVGQHTTTEIVTQQSATKPYSSVSTPESAPIPAAAMTKESGSTHSQPGTEPQPGRESGAPPPIAM